MNILKNIKIVTFWHSVLLYDEDNKAWRITWSLPDYDECLLKLLSWDFRKWINLRKLQSSRRRIKMYRHQIPTNSLSAKVHSTLELTNNDYMAITNSDIFLIPSSNHSAREDPRKIIHTPHKTSLRRHQLHQSKFIYKLMLVASERMKQVTKSLPTIMVILRTHFKS